MKYYIMLCLIILNLCSGIYIINISLNISNDNVSSKEEIKIMNSSFTPEIRISELEKMYEDIDKRKNNVENEPDQILGNDNHIIMIGYYQSQIMILNEIKNQTNQ